MDKEVLVVLVTCPPDEAGKLAERLVESRVAACVNVVPHVRSVYRWQGKVQRDDEALLLAKTTADRFEALKACVLEHHPYDVPEVIGLPVGKGHGKYLEWVMESVK